MRSTEARVYLGLLAGGTVLLGLVLWFTAGVDEPQYTSFARCMRDAGFSLVSVQTCTGYATADFDLWPSSCRMILMVAAAIGACTGSTGGGIKVARAVVVARAALAAVRAFARPRGVHPILLDGRPVADSVGSAALSYFALWMMAAVGGAVALALLGADLVTATTSVISCLNNVGPGLSLVGPSGNYAHFDPISKVLLSFLMIAGRLELYALVSLFLPGFWRR